MRIDVWVRDKAHPRQKPLRQNNTYIKSSGAVRRPTNLDKALAQRTSEVSGEGQQNKKLSCRTETALQGGSVSVRQRVVHFMHKFTFKGTSPTNHLCTVR